MERLVRAPTIQLQRPDRVLPLPLPALIETAEARNRWMERLAGWLGLDALAVTETYADTMRLVRRCAPALIVLDRDTPSLVAVVRGGQSNISVLDREGKIQRLP